MQFSLGWNRAGAQTPASISSSRLQDRNFTQRGPRKSIEDDFMGKRRNCGVNEHLCFCTDANDTQQVTTRCIIAPFILKGFGRCCVREHHAPSLQMPARLPVDGTRFSEAPSPDRRSVLPDRPESFPAFRHGCKGDAHALSGSAPTSLAFKDLLPVLTRAQLLLCFGFFAAEIGNVGFGLGHGITLLFQKIKSQTIRSALQLIVWRAKAYMVLAV